MKNLRIRKKHKTTESDFKYEVILVDVYDIPKVTTYSWFNSSEKEKNRYLDVMNFISIIKNTISSYKIIHKSTKIGQFKIRILLKEESDIVVLTLAGSQLIEKIYTYSPALDVK